MSVLRAGLGVGLGAVLGALVLAGCALPAAMGPATPDMPQLADPARAFAVAGGALGAVILPPDRRGAPPTRALTVDAWREGRATWLGHAGFLIRMGGASVLVDPILSERMELPLSPPRLSAAPDLALDRLDAVLISHEDHDHYDIPTLRGIAAAFPGTVLVGPPDLTPDPALLGFARVVVLAPWEATRIGGLTVTATPAVHYGRRDMIGLDPHPALGFALRGGGLALFHAGDTARGPVHAAAGERLGPFDLALVPIGAFMPENALGDVHATPEGALAIAAELGAARALGMHWGTFAMSADSPQTARDRFLAAARAGGPLPIVTDIGQTIRIRP